MSDLSNLGWRLHGSPGKARPPNSTCWVWGPMAPIHYGTELQTPEHRLITVGLSLTPPSQSRTEPLASCGVGPILGSSQPGLGVSHG